MSTPRRAAFNAIYRVFSEKAYSNIAVDDEIKLLQEGKAFATRLAYGVIERKLTLDYLINKYCSKPKPKVKIILEMGAYQLCFMNKVPASAAIDESVKLAKEIGLSFYSGLINAVLHKINDNRINFDDIEDLSVKYSVPQNLINLWIKQYGEKTTVDILNSANGRPPVYAIPNSIKLNSEELCDLLKSEGVDAVTFEGIVLINSSADITETKAFSDGLFHIQDLSCYKAVKALDIKQESTVLDICSAPGGKSFTAAYACNDNAKVYSYDLYPQRVDLIKKGASRLGLQSISTFVNDASKSNPDIPVADYIICDVPCSGFGIIRRKPEIRYKELDSVKELPELQYSILKTSSRYLKHGGRIMYSTCTLNKKENEKVVERFLNEHNEFIMIAQKTFFPDANGGDGFFYSIIERL